jgi:competence protein ComEC
MNWGQAFKSKPLVFICLSFCVGLLIAITIPNPAIAFLCLLMTFCFLWFVKKDWAFTATFMFLIFAGGWYDLALQLSTTQRQVAQLESYHGKQVSFTGIISDQKVFETQCRLTVKRGTITDPETGQTFPTGFLVYIRGDFIGELGDTVSGIGKMKKLMGKRNPGEFDFKEYYLRRNIYVRLYTTSEQVELKEKGQSVSLTGFYSQVRAAVKRSLVLAIGPESGLITALILGDKSQVDPEVKQSFVRTGVIHVLAVSGLHVGFILILLISLARLFRIPWGWDRLFLILGLCFYVGLTGGKPSVVRASIMAGLYLLAPVVNRPVNIWNIIALAALAILVVDPLALQDLGFQLSFMAVISIIVLYEQFQRILPEHLRVNRIENKGIQSIWALFLVSLSAQIGTLPFIAYYFHRVSLVAFLANLMIVPLVGVLLATGFLIVLLGWLPVLGMILGQAAWFLTRVIQSLANAFSVVKFAMIPVKAWEPVTVLTYYVLLAGFFLFLQSQYRSKGIILLLLVANVLVWRPAVSKPGWNILFLDVGEGDAAVITFPEGKAMLIDSGQRTRYRDYGAKTVVPLLEYLGIHHLNWLVATHPHNDHIGGLLSVVETFPVDTVWEIKTSFNSLTFQQLNERLRENGTVIQYPTAGTAKWLGPHELVEFFNPIADLPSSNENLNNRSLVFKLLAGKVPILFPGDLEQEGEAVLLAYNDLLKADLLKVAHHGAATSTTIPFLNLTRPELAIVSVGDGNKFGHPAPFILRRLEKAGVKIHRTDQQGALWIWTDGNTYREIIWK